MADVDIDPFGEHEYRPDKPTGKDIPLTPVGGRSAWEPGREQETSFRGGLTQEMRLTNSYVDSLYKLSKHYSQISDATYHDKFRRTGKQHYFKGKDDPLTNEDGS